MSKGGAVLRALASHQCGPDLRSWHRRHMWVEFVVGSLLCSERFLGTPVIPSPQKPTFSNSNSTRNHMDEEPLSGFATSKSSFVYLFITSRYDNCWQKHSNCISLYYFVDHVHNVSKMQTNPLESERVPTKPVTFRTKKVLTASNILVRNCYISGYCYILLH